MKLTKEAAEARRAYMARWREENPERVKSAQVRYWTKKAAEKQAEQEDEDGRND